MTDLNRPCLRAPCYSKWVEVIVVEYENLCWKGVFDEMEVALDACIHDGCLVFTEKVGSEGEITQKRVRIVTKGYMEVWGEDFMHMYSPTLGCDTLSMPLAYAASHDLEIHQLNAVTVYLNSNLSKEIYLQPPDGVRLSPG